MAKFRLKVWDGDRNLSRVVEAVSYEAAHNTYIAPLPPSHIATLEPITPTLDDVFKGHDPNHYPCPRIH